MLPEFFCPEEKLPFLIELERFFYRSFASILVSSFLELIFGLLLL